MSDFLECCHKIRLKHWPPQDTILARTSTGLGKPKELCIHSFLNPRLLR